MARVLALAAAVVVATCAAASARAAPLEAYGGLPTLEQIAISPNGRLLAIDVVKGEQRTIVIEDMATKKLVSGVKVGETEVRNLQWVGNDHLIITSSATMEVDNSEGDTRSEWMLAGDFNVVTGKLRPLLGDTDGAANMLYRLPILRYAAGKPLLFLQGIRFIGGVGQATLFKVDLDRDRSSPMLDTPGEIGVDYLLSSDGKPLAMAKFDPPQQTWTLNVWDGKGWRQAQSRKTSIDAPQLAGLGRDGKSILVEATEGERLTLREIAPDGSGASEPLPGFSSVLRDPVTQGMIGTAKLNGGDVQYDFFDPGDQLRWRAVNAAFKGKIVNLVSWSDDRHTLVVRVRAPEEAPSYALVDLDGESTVTLGSDYPGLAPADISPVQTITYKAQDGLQLTGFLTLPRGKDQRSLPLVVFPHGGPDGWNGPGFDWWAQAMASRGYAVLQVNFRGSKTPDETLVAAGYGEWGRKMQSDLSDGVRHLSAQGTIDSARVCIVGVDYGGYAALAGAAFEAGVYRCAVDVAGQADLAKFVSWSKQRGGDRGGPLRERYWTRFMGANGLADPHLAEISPADHADKVTIPVLIIHGKDDTVVPFEQSQIMADALRKAGRNVDMVVLNHEDHWLSRSATRLQMLQATMDFLAKNNPAN